MSHYHSPHSDHVVPDQENLQQQQEQEQQPNQQHNQGASYSKELK